MVHFGQRFTYLRFGGQERIRSVYSCAEKHSIGKMRTGLPNELIQQQITMTGCRESPVLLRVTLWCACFAFKETSAFISS